jgi:ATP-dependent RNA helicase TDRD9
VICSQRVLEDEGVPEILRCPLDQLILQAKLFDMGEPKALLALCLDPPDLTYLENSILVLKEVSLPFLVADKLYNKAQNY